MCIDIFVMGDVVIGVIKLVFYGMYEGGYIIDYDLVVSNEFVCVFLGGIGNNCIVKVSE